MNSPTTTRLAVPADREELAALCLEAFADEAVITWALPDPATRPVRMRAMFEASLDEAVAAETVLLAVTGPGAPSAVSFWNPRDGAPTSDGPRPDHGDGPEARRLTAIEEATEAVRPDVPHLHLSSMAVRPAQRGRGAGSAMLTAGLARADALELPVHLEASTPAARRLYLRHGFRDHGPKMQLPDDGPVLQPMWRERSAP